VSDHEQLAELVIAGDGEGAKRLTSGQPAICLAFFVFLLALACGYAMYMRIVSPAYRSAKLLRRATSTPEPHKEEALRRAVEAHPSSLEAGWALSQRLILETTPRRPSLSSERRWRNSPATHVGISRGPRPRARRVLTACALP